MIRSIDRRPYAYRSDPDVPQFDDTRPIAFLDGACALCCFGARAISKLDRSGDIRLCAVQNAIGRSVLHHYGIDPDAPDSWLYLEDGQAFTGLDAMIKVVIYGGRGARIARLLARLPKSWRDWIYRRIARNRYVFGRSDLCHIPAPDLRARLIQ